MTEGRIKGDRQGTKGRFSSVLSRDAQKAFLSAVREDTEERGPRRTVPPPASLRCSTPKYLLKSELFDKPGWFEQFLWEIKVFYKEGWGKYRVFLVESSRGGFSVCFWAHF